MKGDVLGKGDVRGIGNVTAVELKLLSEEMHYPSAGDPKVTYVDVIRMSSLAGMSSGCPHVLQSMRLYEPAEVVLL